MRLVLVRHGESERNVGAIVHGPEPHLTEQGRRQAAYAAERAGAERFDALYTSPMSRALETAAALSEATGLAPVARVDLAEIRELPGFFGGARSSLAERYPGICLPPDCTEAGWWTGLLEDEAALFERAGRALAALRQQHEGSRDRLLVVTHAGLASALLSVLLDLPPCGYLRFPMENGAFSTVALVRGAVLVHALNDTRHLPPPERTDISPSEARYLASVPRTTSPAA